MGPAESAKPLNTQELSQELKIHTVTSPTLTEHPELLVLPAMELLATEQATLQVHPMALVVSAELIVLQLATLLQV